MLLKDARGDAVSGATAEALDAFESALAGFQCYAGNPLEHLDRAVAAAPDFTMAHVMRAHLLLAGSEAAVISPARDSLAKVRPAAMTDRERMHVTAANDLADGRFDAAAEHFENILLAHPRDALALQMGHLIDFYRGDSRNLRDRVVRVLPAWTSTTPGYHALQGMLAFGLEECGDYASAEEIGRRACDLNPRDAWAHHAVSHVLEMRGRTEDGISWMRTRETHWSVDNFFAIHNWWHLALYHLDRDEIAEVLKIYDERVRATTSVVVLDMVDAAAMLWRLHLRGIDVGAARWREIAEVWAPLADDGFYSFNDVHGMATFLGAGRDDLVERQLSTLRRVAGSQGCNAAMTREVGLPVAEAMVAFARGKFDRTVDLLRPVRNFANRFGGSHAQRDLVDLTLIEAAKRGGQVSLVRALAAERLRAKPQSPIALRYLGFANERRAA